MRGWMVGWAMVAILLTGCDLGPPKPHVDYDPGTVEFYRQDVEPILRSNCYRCHGGMNRKGDFSMQTREKILHGGKHGPAIFPTDPAESSLVRLIRHEGPKDNPMPMPDKRKKLSDADIAIVVRWIQAGAVMP